MAHTKFHLSMPTPLHPMILLATGVLLVLHLVGLPVAWWVVFAPMWLSTAFIVVALVSLRLVVRILNHREPLERRRLYVRPGDHR